MAASLLRRKIPIIGKYWSVSPHRTGYIVLLPEVKDEDKSKNPIRNAGLPDYSNITAEQGYTGVMSLALDNEVQFRKLEEKFRDAEMKKQFSTVIEPLQKIDTPLYNAWDIVRNLYLVKNNIITSDIYMRIHKHVKKARGKKFQSLPFYHACKEINADSHSLDEVQKRVVSKFLLEGRLNGIELAGVQTEHYRTVQNNLIKKTKLYSDKMQEGLQKFQHKIFDPKIVQDFPHGLLKALATDKTQPTRGPWIVTLQPYIYQQFLQHCPDRRQRWKIWEAYNTVCSAHQDYVLNTVYEIAEIRDLRNQEATLLGYDTYAQLSMETKMAGNVENVQSMITKLLAKAKPAQDREVEALQEYASSRGFGKKLKLWDVPYWRRKQSITLFNFKEDVIREYFPLPRVLEGMFNICEELFNIEIEEVTGQAKIWHQDVKFYRIHENGSVVAFFFLDPYRRLGEKLYIHEQSAWVLNSLCYSDGFSSKTQQVANLIFNFPPPMFGRPCLLSFEEVGILFSKFGHALQHLLSTVPYNEVTGQKNIEWDATEVCSNLMKNWLTDRYILKQISGHYETGDPLSEEMIQNLCQLWQHMAGFDMCQELYRSAMDLEMYNTTDFWVEIMTNLWPQYISFPLEKNDYHPCSFKEIFSEEQAAAYYTHLWSKMIAADAFTAFLETGFENKENMKMIGKRFRSTFLALGGGCHPCEVFRRFRGRDASVEALLCSYGLKQPKSPKTERRLIH